MGYALDEALYGEEGLARTAIFPALLLPLHSLIGYFSMDRQLSAGERSGILGKVLWRLAVNPVIMMDMPGILGRTPPP